MKTTLSWIKKYLDTDASIDQISEKLTAIGLEVEEVIDRSEELSSFKIAQIIDAKPHPDADKLSICKVDTGTEQLQIVCGAPNARSGINVVLAPVGSIIPTNGMKIKASKIRGVESNGMLCSAAELGVGEDEGGIIEMPACNDNIAQNFANYAGLNDPVIDIAITPNRGDCLGAYGIARDLAASGIGKLKKIDVKNIEGKFKSPINIKLEAEESCPYFIGRYFKDVKNTESPKWLKQKLESVGLRPISALVDITNYIAYEFGRPLHVYDAAKINGDLTARFAQKGEEFTSLDEKTYRLDEDIAVIADDNGAQAISGVIGGLNSGCDENTTDVFLEVAWFDPIKVSTSGRKFDIITDSRYRFERYVDPDFMLDAAQIASQMIIDLCKGKPSELVIAGKSPAKERKLSFNREKISQLGGIEIDRKASDKILNDLGFDTKEADFVKIPSWRPDIEGEADLVEEIVRIFGYDNVPTIPLPQSENIAKSLLTPEQERVSNIRKELAKRGMTEAISWSFMHEDKAKLFGYNNSALKLQNPISSDLNVMRPSILPNLIDAIGRNNARDFKNISLFEIGLIFEGIKPKEQKQFISAVRSGQAVVKNAYDAARNVDIFDIKADLLAALKIAGIPVENLKTNRNAPGYYHPGRSASLSLGKNILGYFGEIHPAILKEMDVKGPIAGFEIDISAFPPVRAKKTTSKKRLEISDYQGSVRDFAFIMDEKYPVGDLLQSVKNTDKNLIESVSLFDIYQGKGVDEGKKSVAISVNIQPQDKTLSDKELEELSNKIITLVEKAGGVLRG
ncbi:phenylalanine--tRNA ligase subunit beta [Rickettsiales bacterium]|nr:phenylalanine--tRNA ligase subunit beta [Rickettsiales bacterium]